MVGSVFKQHTYKTYYITSFPGPVLVIIEELQPFS